MPRCAGGGYSWSADQDIDERLTEITNGPLATTQEA